MASIQETIAKATRHLGDMTFSQRLAIVLGVMLVFGSIIWMAQWAATPEMVSLLPGQNLEAEDLATVRAGLDAMNEPYQLDGSQIMVRAASNRQAIIASLQQAEKLPSDTAIGFSELVKEANPWISQSENERRWTVALQSELARVLQMFNGVKQARVLLNMNSKKGFARSHPESTAGVTLFMKAGEPVTRSLALAAARMVAGAVRGLPVKNVQVIDGANGCVALDWDSEETGTASNLHQQRKQLERDKELQIKELLRYDRDALVGITVELEYSTTQIQDLSVSEGTATMEKTDETSTVRNRQSAQPGVQPNVGTAVSSGNSGDTSTTGMSEFQYDPSRKTTVTQTPAGVPKSINAAISLSYSYLAGIYRHNNPDTEEAPTETQIEEVFDKQKDRITAQVAKLVLPPDPEQVSVDWHYDSLEPVVVAEPSTADVSLDLAQKYGPASGLGLLALLALGMMMKLAKRPDEGQAFGMEIGLPKEAIDAARQAADDIGTVSVNSTGSKDSSSDGNMAAGSAGEVGGPGVQYPIGEGDEGVLEAQEVDEASVQVTKMISQVATAAEQDSNAVAQLVETWIDQNS